METKDANRASKAILGSRAQDPEDAQVAQKGQKT